MALLLRRLRLAHPRRGTIRRLPPAPRQALRAEGPATDPLARAQTQPCLVGQALAAHPRSGPAVVPQMPDRDDHRLAHHRPARDRSDPPSPRIGRRLRPLRGVPRSATTLSQGPISHLAEPGIDTFPRAPPHSQGTAPPAYRCLAANSASSRPISTALRRDPARCAIAKLNPGALLEPQHCPRPPAPARCAPLRAR